MPKDRQVRFSLHDQTLGFSGLFGSEARAEVPEALPEEERRAAPTFGDQLGEPITIRDVARLIGCSVWTVRQQCMRQGLPYFRVSRSGKLIFYRNQVIRWLIEKQNIRR
jgi:hypothetical protein